MQIGHTGRARVIEFIIATALLIIAVRTSLPIGNSVGVYGFTAIKVTFAFIIAAPPAWLLIARTLSARRTALLWTCVTYSYVATLVPIVDWTRFGTAAALFALAAVSGYLYYITAREIKWTKALSSRSSPPLE